MLDPEVKSAIIEATLEELNTRLLEAGGDSDFDFADVMLDLVAVYVIHTAEPAGGYERSLDALYDIVKTSLVQRGMWDD